ncbi:MAG TPA: hypothetical protein VGI16_05480 [Candidatus Acidoferrum sp.]
MASIVATPLQFRSNELQEQKNVDVRKVDFGDALTPEEITRVVPGMGWLRVEFASDFISDATTMQSTASVSAEP